MNSSKSENPRIPDQFPIISVIIPYHNNLKEAEEIVQVLFRQSYPEDRVEIICIDNGYDKWGTNSEILRKKCVNLEEKNYINSPYSARNRGIEAATGDILVFIDANSYPAENWLLNGVRYLLDNNADLIAGAVDFDYDGKITSAKITDALTSIQMKKSVEERGVAYTANLFVRPEVFKKAGLFEEGVRSGGDVRWTSKAVNLGFKIGYAEDAIVYKIARNATELYRKRIRTGKGYFFTWKEEEPRTIWFYNFFRSLKPPSYSTIKTISSDRYKSEFDNKLPGIWFHLYATAIVEQAAFVYQYLSYVLSSRRDIDRRKKMEERKNRRATE